VVLGATAEVVHSILGVPSRSTAGPEPSDRYDDVHVHYGEDGRCAAVEVWREAEPVLDGRPVLADPFVAMVRHVRRLDPLTTVDADGATSLERGVGLAAPAGVHAPYDPASSVIVFAIGYYGDLFDQAPLPARLAVRGLTWLALERRLREDGWSTEVQSQLAPLVPGEPELVSIRRGDDLVLSAFQPVVGLRTLDLRSCRSDAARSVAAAVPQWASVDSAAALVQQDDVELQLWGLVLAEALSDPKLLEHVEPYLSDPREVVADAARRALGALG
jgi:hypothetical protein